jgi:hypothetical protein
MLKSLKLGLFAALAFCVGLVPGFAFATGTGTAVDLSGLTGAVNYSSVTTAILAIAALVAAVYVAISGVKIVLRMIRSA